MYTLRFDLNTLANTKAKGEKKAALELKKEFIAKVGQGSALHPLLALLEPQSQQGLGRAAKTSGASVHSVAVGRARATVVLCLPRHGSPGLTGTVWAHCGLS